MSYKLITASTAALAAATFATGAFAQDTGYYIQGHGGANFVVQDDIEIAIEDTAAVEGSYDADTGYVIGGAFGKIFGNGFRSDLELTYRTNDIDNVDFDGIDDVELEADGEIATTALMLNGYYDFQTNGNWTPYIGAGLGYANVDIEDDNDGVFAYQFKGGVARAVSPKGSIGAEATYFATTDAEFEDDGVSGEVEYGSTSLQVFYRHAL